jgi:hypothetical protein
MADVGVAGYSGGGDISNTRQTTVNKFAFPSDTRSVLALTTATGKQGAMAHTAGL